MPKSEQAWQVRITSDMELNFLIYVACYYGLLIEGNELWPDPAVQLEDDQRKELNTSWRQFWDESLLTKAKHPHSYMLSPPHFNTIDCSLLRDSFDSAWPSFIRWWLMPAGGQLALNYWESQPFVTAYVQEFEREAGRPIRPFKLVVDLVYAGISEPVEVSDDYVIMPVSSKYLMKKDWWLRRFKERY